MTLVMTMLMMMVNLAMVNDDVGNFGGGHVHGGVVEGDDADDDVGVRGGVCDLGDDRAMIMSMTMVSVLALVI